MVLNHSKLYIPSQNPLTVDTGKMAGGKCVIDGKTVCLEFWAGLVLLHVCRNCGNNRGLHVFSGLPIPF